MSYDSLCPTYRVSLNTRSDTFCRYWVGFWVGFWVAITIVTYDWLYIHCRLNLCLNSFIYVALRLVNEIYNNNYIL